MFSASSIAETLEELATLLEFQGENVFKIRAFRGAAVVVRDRAENLDNLIADAQAGKVAGIGKQLVQIIDRLYREGELPELETLRQRSPAGLTHLLKVPGLGTKKLKALYSELRIQSLSDLEKACLEGRVGELKGFGEKTQQQILHGVLQIKEYEGKFLFSRSFAAAQDIERALQASGGVDEVALSGALRRRMEVLGAIKLVVIPNAKASVAELCRALPFAKEVRDAGPANVRFSLSSGQPVELTVATKENFAATLLIETGNDSHVQKLQQIAGAMELNLSSLGLRGKDGRIIAAGDEAALYRHLGLAYIPPELREGAGEVDVAAANPKAFLDLVDLKDIKGILHVHSTWSDGRHSLRELAVATANAGYQYLGVSDHSKSAGYAGGLSIERIKAQQQEIDELNHEISPFRIFKGIESDILMDGSLDYADEVLATFDFVVASVHSYMTLSAREMTGRILRALRSPYTTILGHPTGRLLLEREDYELDMDAVLKVAAEERTAIELNCNPHRLDLDWRLLPLARGLGIKIPLCPDAHSIEGLKDIEYGIGIARKGGLIPADIPNCLDVGSIEAFFKGAGQQ